MIPARAPDHVGVIVAPVSAPAVITCATTVRRMPAVPLIVRAPQPVALGISGTQRSIAVLRMASPAATPPRAPHVRQVPITTVRAGVNTISTVVPPVVRAQPVRAGIRFVAAAKARHLVPRIAVAHTPAMQLHAPVFRTATGIPRG